MLYSIQSQHLKCFRHRGCWDHWPFGPYFRSLLAIFNTVKSKARSSDRLVILIHNIVASSMAMSYMKELPIPCVLAKKAMEVALISDIKLLNFYPEPASLLE